jgi:hypothetical protein
MPLDGAYLCDEAGKSAGSVRCISFTDLSFTENKCYLSWVHQIFINNPWSKLDHAWKASTDRMAMQLGMKTTRSVLQV